MPSSSAVDPRHEKQPKRRPAGSPLTKYFMVVLFGFSIVSLMVNNRFAHKVHLSEDANVIASVLKDFHVNQKHEQILINMAERFAKIEEMEATKMESSEERDDDEGDDDDNEEVIDDIVDGSDEDNEELNAENGDIDDDDDDTPEVLGEIKEENKGGEPKSSKQGNISHQHLEHRIANLNCEAYGGPSNKDAEEMVYWEDIPKDALHVSPFHAKHPDKKKEGSVEPITQYLTFEPDEGGWNNIRMAMGKYASIKALNFLALSSLCWSRVNNSFLRIQ